VIETGAYVIKFAQVLALFFLSSVAEQTGNNKRVSTGVTISILRIHSAFWLMGDGGDLKGSCCSHFTEEGTKNTFSRAIWSAAILALLESLDKYME